MTVDEAMNYARDELESAFEKWLSDECPSGDCESVQRQWDESFVHQELVDELQPVMALTWEVSQLREENERLRKDAERYRWLRESVKKSGGITKAQSYFWNYGGSPKRLDAAIDAARGTK